MYCKLTLQQYSAKPLEYVLYYSYIFISYFLLLTAIFYVGLLHTREVGGLIVDSH